MVIGCSSVAAVGGDLITGKLSGTADGVALQLRANPLPSAIFSHCKCVNFGFGQWHPIKVQHRAQRLWADRLNGKS